jgi:preprotein translocase subunit SecA
MYEKISGMTGTAETSKEEFFKVYGLDVVVVPTNKPVIRNDKEDLIFATEEGKFEAIAKAVKGFQEKGQPVLIGTASVEKSEKLSEFLQKEKVEHTLLNAKNHENEGQIIADAGKKGHVTVATNMAGRGVDIKLGGAEATEKERQEILDLGGLVVIGTERHESRRIDNQLRGRSGRQGDPGETQFYVSLDDDLVKVFGNKDFLKKILLQKMELEGGKDVPVSMKMMSKGIEKAQTAVEGFHFDGRKHVLEYDDVLDIQRKSIYAKRQKILKSSDEELENIFKNDFSGEEEFLAKVEEKKQELGEEEFYPFLRKIYLENIDKM